MTNLGSSMKIKSKLYIGFGAVVTLIVILATMSMTRMLGIGDTFSEYRETARVNLSLANVAEDIFEARIAGIKFRSKDTEQLAEEVRSNLAEVEEESRILKEFGSSESFKDDLVAINDDLSSYLSAFDSSVELQAQRNVLVDRMSATGSEARRELSAILDEAQSRGLTNVAHTGRQVLESFMLGRSYAERFLLTNEEEPRARSKEELRTALSRMPSLRSGLLGTELTGRLDGVSGMISDYLETIEGVSDVILQRNAFRQQMDALGPVILGRAEQIQDSQVDLQNTLGPAAVSTIDNTIVTIIGISIFCVLAGIGIAFMLSRQLSSGIKRLTDSMARVADGHLEEEVPDRDRQDEIGDMARALVVFRDNGLKMREMDQEKARTEERSRQERAHMMQELQTAFGDVVDAAADGDFSRRVTKQFDDKELNTISQGLNKLVETVDQGLSETIHVLKAVAQADLTARIEGKYNGVFEDLKGATNATADRLTEIVGNLQVASGELNSATQEILSGSNDLSDRTTRQAATIEETSAAMQQMSRTVLENAQRANDARETVGEARSTAESGGEVMQNATAAMERIKTSSSKISDIIGMIDSIAFQTNLLALNASVEAARAGEAGKGFAVVATEVRRLAQSAAQASQEVKTLIETSVTEVGEGSALVDKAASNLEMIVTSVRDVTELMNAIADESRGQAESLEQLNAAVKDMDEMTQHNAALVEETNAAIEQTRQQVTSLNGVVGQFRVNSDATAVHAPRQNPVAGDARGLQQQVARTVKAAAPAAPKPRQLVAATQANAALDMLSSEVEDWSEF